MYFSGDDDSPIYAAIGFCAGIYFFFKGFKTFREYRVVEDTPEMPIRSIPMGLVRVHGQAQGAEVISSPVSYLPCYFYKVDIEKWHKDKDGGHWTKYRTDADGVRFYLQDATGKVLVDAHDAEYDLVQNRRAEIGGSGLLGRSGASEAELRRYVTAVTTKKIGSFAERRFNLQRPGLEAQHANSRQAAQEMFKHTVGSSEFLEHVLAALGPRFPKHLEEVGPQSDPEKEQARLAMLEAYQYPPGSPQFRENMQRAIASRVVGGPGGAAGGVDTAVATQISSGGESAYAGFPETSGRFRFTEYCIVPDHWYDVTGSCTENPRPQDEHDRNLILKGHNEPTFLISYRSHKEVERLLRRRAAWQIFGGAGVSLACLAFLLYYFDLF